MVSGRLATSRKSGPGDPENINDRFERNLSGERSGFRQASQI